MPTAERLYLAETESGRWKEEALLWKSKAETFIAAAEKKEAALRRHEAEQANEKPNAIAQFLELLSSQPEETWAEHLIGMGTSYEVPKLFRCAGKIRNRNLSKRETEKLVKEIWKARVTDPNLQAGRAPDFGDFLFTVIQKRMGIASAVTELAYSLLYGLWKYRWDADCELFLKVLTGEAQEEVYHSQLALQSELETMFSAMDRLVGGSSSGFVKKAELRLALGAYFRAGQPGGKSEEDFDALLKALDEDQPGESVRWAKLFEEDREYNQGEFAECVRDQFLSERVARLAALEQALWEACDHER
ncbi:hypothetical protein H632_c879p0, partial [Helicosporidium sp. ATCC 50920]